MVSDLPNKYKVFEFYVNELQFGDEADDGIDLFIALTPCTGLLKYFISDDFQNLFTERSELKHSNKFSYLDASVEN